MIKNFGITVTDAVNPVTYLWSIQNAPNVSINGLANLHTVQISYNQESDLVGGSLKCIIIDSSGCQKVKTIDLIPNTLPTPVNKEYTISCQNLVISDFIGGASVSILSGTHTGTMSIGQNNSLTYSKVNSNYTDVFTYRFFDSNNVSQTATITIHVSVCAQLCSNTVMVSNVQFSDIAHSITFDVTVTGLYDENDLSVFSNIGTPVSQGNGAYSIDVTQSGSFIITAHLQNTNCDISDVKSVNAVLTPSPIAVNDSYYGDMNSDLTLYPLTNDSDPAGGVLSIVSINGQVAAIGTAVVLSYGTFTLNSDGSILFSANKDYQGTFTLPYTIQSSLTGKTASAVISIAIQCFKPVIELLQFVGPVSSNGYKAIYDFIISGNQNSSVVSTVNNTPFVLSSHVEINSSLLNIGYNRIDIHLTTCDTTTFTHSFNVTELP